MILGCLGCRFLVYFYTLEYIFRTANALVGVMPSAPQLGPHGAATWACVCMCLGLWPG